MRIVKALDEPGVEIPAPYRRRIKVLFAPDKEGVAELTFSHVTLPAGGRTDYHQHDRPELIYVVAGEGACVHEGGRTPLEPEMALWAAAGESHQIVNTGQAEMKLVTVFVPGYTAADNYKRCLEAARGAGAR